MRPNTLLISADGTYPGIVVDPLSGMDAQLWCRVKWYKWGYKSPDFYIDLERIVDVALLVEQPETVRRKFGALPPEYVDPYADLLKRKEGLSDQIQRSLKQTKPSAEEIDNEVRKLVDAIVYAVYDKNVDLVDDWTETLVNYVLGLLK